MSYPAHLRHVLRHNRKVLVQVQRVKIERVERIRRRTVSLAPLAGFCCTEVVGRVDIAGAPVSLLESLHRACLHLELLLAAEGFAVGGGDFAGLVDGSDYGDG